jgi:hypothetical protein
MKRGARQLLSAGLIVVAGCAVPAPPPPSVQEPTPSPQPDPVRTGFSFEGTFSQGSLVRGVAPAGTAGLSLDGEPIAVDGEGRFLLGFDRDQASHSRLVARLADGRAIAEDLRIAPRAWNIEQVDVALRPDGSTEEYLRIRNGELARIAAARAKTSKASGWRQQFIWPARGRISGVFGSQRVYRGEPGSYHSGVDVAPGAGAPVVAPADGIVVLAGPPAFSLEGNLVIVDHGMGLNSAFLHLASSAVREGQAVRQGQLIGTVGATGRATGPHLHWGMKWNAARIDPQSLAGPM